MDKKYDRSKWIGYKTHIECVTTKSEKGFDGELMAFVISERKIICSHQLMVLMLVRFSLNHILIFRLIGEIYSLSVCGFD